ncbi:MAG: alkaline phosphatase, partial [Acidimicrobiia bacterium]
MSSPTRSAAVAAGLALAVTGMAAFPASTGATGNSTPMYLEHAGTAFLQLNQSADEIADEAPSSAEIIDFTANGKQLVYSDSLAGRIGFLDTSSVSDPVADGTVDLPGDPTSVAIHRQWALVSINTSDSFDDPSGELLVIRLKDRSIVRTIPLGGQPDAIAISPTGKYAAIAIENERDEDENDGLIPQAPGGLLQIVDLRGNPGKWTVRDVDLSGLDGMFAASDAEPEYVDINRRDLAVVTLQENNHLAIVDLKTGDVVNHFPAGSVDEVPYVDTVEEDLGPQGNGLISLTGTVEDRRREPDAVAWVDDDTFATANEGDYEDDDGDEGGSRSFTLFNVDGTVEYEAGNSFEHLIASIGHYPEGRSENKGNEPEGLEVGTFQNRTLLFVASERANAVGVYEIVDGTPELVQVLPTGIGPEGLKFRNGVLAVSAEVDGFDEGFAARPFVTFFEMRRTATPTYPYLVSGPDADNGSMAPIPWVAQSALAGDPVDPDVLYST